LPVETDVSWFKRAKKGVEGVKKKPVPDGLWQKCDFCGEILYVKELEKQLWVCSKCDYHFMISTDQYIQILCDEGSFEETHGGITSGDPLDFKDLKRYKDRVREYAKKTGREEAVVTGLATMSGRDIVLVIMDFSFMGGSMGSVVGEKIYRAAEQALRLRRPLVVVSRSGGARMQESIFSLMQMAKTSAMLQRLGEESVPYVSILTNPTTGGVTASFASLGDVIIAEPKALIGFAGPRVIQQTIRQDLPEGFQRSEFLLEHGMIDMIRSRDELRPAVEGLLDFFCRDLESRTIQEVKDDDQSPAVS
jgi:acetyl-CoA carboxylase carboxyl transferase subunit beta